MDTAQSKRYEELIRAETRLDIVRRLIETDGNDCYIKKDILVAVLGMEEPENGTAGK